MLNPIAAPRDGLTVDEVTALLRSPSVAVSSHLETVDPDTLAPMEDVSDLLEAGSVSRDNYATLHGSCSLTLTAPLSTNTLVRPYIVLSDRYGDTSARFNMGAYFVTSPDRPLGGESTAANGFDRLIILNDFVGDSYTVAAGTAYLTAIETILTALGVTASIDPAAAAKTLPSARVWPMEDGLTWLHIINGLLASVGYRAMWSDDYGHFTTAPYVAPGARAPEWEYDTRADDTLVGLTRSVKADTFGAPNRWIFIRDMPAEGAAEDGDGRYVVVNESTGPTSVAAVGRTITQVTHLEAASQADLVVQGDAHVDASANTHNILSMAIEPNPLHWHFDVVSYLDHADSSLLPKQAVRSWSLDLVTGLMAQTWRGVS